MPDSLKDRKEFIVFFYKLTKPKRATNALLKRKRQAQKTKKKGLK